MVLPLIALCAVAVLTLVGVARDSLLAQDLARLGVRVAATTPSDAAVRTAITAAAGGAVRTEVSITPTVRTTGTTVTVRVVLRRPGRLLDVDVAGRAVARGEPQVEEGMS